MTQVRPDRRRRQPLRARPAPASAPEAPAPDAVAPPPPAPAATAPPAPPQAVPAPGAPGQTPPGSSEWSPMSAPPPPAADEQAGDGQDHQPTADPPAAGPSSSKNPLQGLADLLVRQGTPAGAPVAPWRPVAAGAVIAAGGVLILLQALIGADLIDIVLVLGLAMLVAGFLDGTGRRFRGPGVALVSVGIIGRFVGDTSFLGEGWGFGVFMLIYGAYVVLERQRHRDPAAG
ncbi:MAG TPA: hypothetical protein VNT56_00885 [Acidimicrobiales bacterium]|nr:hypothetical protein [Acidimicrobiales bacterium]